MPFVHSKKYGREMILLAKGNYQLRTGCKNGRVYADYVRVYNTKTRKDVSYWNLEEVVDDIKASGDDYSTAFNSILSSIELIFTGDIKMVEGWLKKGK